MFSNRQNIITFTLALVVLTAYVNSKEQVQTRRKNTVLFDRANQTQAILQAKVVCPINDHLVDGVCHDFRFKCKHIERDNDNLPTCRECDPPYWPTANGDRKYCANKWHYYVILSAISLLMVLLVFVGIYMLITRCVNNKEDTYEEEAPLNVAPADRDPVGDDFRNAELTGF